MTISLLQTDIKWADSVANKKAAECALFSSTPSDLYILPEMFSTGFATKPEGIAEEDNNTLAWMKNMAERLNSAIAGSVAIKTEEGDYRNRFYFVKPDGVVEYYDKRHLFTYGGEDRHYACGNNRVIVEWRGVRFLLQVCYDLRFPVFARNVAKGNETASEDGAAYDAVIYVANWPESRRRVWNILLQARAIENQCFVIGVNRVGDDEVCHYNGGTTLIDAYGKEVIKASDNESCVITATLDIERQKGFRKKFPVLNDADKYTI